MDEKAAAARAELAFILKRQQTVSTRKLDGILRDMGFYVKTGETFTERQLKRELESTIQSKDSFKRRMKKLAKTVEKLEDQIAAMDRNRRKIHSALGSYK